MFNFIKMDFYRMTKNRMFWVCLLATIVIMFSSVLLTKSDINYYEQNPKLLEAVEEQMSGTEDWGVYIGSTLPEWCKGERVATDILIVNNIQSKLLLIFLVVFLVGYITAETKSGFLQHIATTKENRRKIMLSSMIMALIFTVLQFICAVASIVITSNFAFGYLNIINFDKLIAFLVMEILLQVSFASFILMLIIVTRNRIVSVVIGLLSSAGLLQVIDPLVQTIMSRTRDFSIMPYSIVGNIGTVSINSTMEVFIRAIVIMLMSLCIYLLISVYWFEKKDIET